MKKPAPAPPTLKDRGIVIVTKTFDPYRITHNGRPCRLAIVDDETGAVVASGPEVARECCALGIMMTEQVWAGAGWIEAINEPPLMAAAEARLPR